MILLYIPMNEIVTIYKEITMMKIKRIMLACLISGLSVFAMNAMDKGSGFEYEDLAGRLAVSTWIRDTFFHELGRVHAWGTEEEKEKLKARYNKQEDDKEIAPLLLKLKEVLEEAVCTTQDWHDISLDFSNRGGDYTSLGEAAVNRYKAIGQEIKEFIDRFEVEKVSKGSDASKGKKKTAKNVDLKSKKTSRSAKPASLSIASFITRKSAFLAGIAALAIGGIVWKLYFEDTKKKTSVKAK